MIVQNEMQSDRFGSFDDESHRDIEGNAFGLRNGEQRTVDTTITRTDPEDIALQNAVLMERNVAIRTMPPGPQFGLGISCSIDRQIERAWHEICKGSN